MLFIFADPGGAEIGRPQRDRKRRRLSGMRCLVIAGQPGDMDTYKSYRHLQSCEKEGRDYDVVRREGRSRMAVVAIHGGAIEPGTAGIAEGVAGNDHALYIFRGRKPFGNRTLHLTANRFDEPRGRALAESADTVIAVHGCRGDRPVVYVGGRDLELRGRIRDALTQAGFDARQSARRGLRGLNPDNICNRGASGRGVQLEISVGLRRELFDVLERGRGRNRTPAYFRFVEAVRAALETAGPDGAAEGRGEADGQ